MALLGLCLELSFNVLYCRTQPNPPTLSMNPQVHVLLRITLFFW